MPIDPFIRQGDSPLRYFVKSRSNKGTEYLVEVDAYAGVGKCECKHFRIRLEKAVRSGKAVSDEAPYRCWHIERARNYLLGKLISALVEQRRTRGVSDDPHAEQTGPEKH